MASADWLGSRPVFYNLKTGRFGPRIFDVVDKTAIEIDKAGLGDYLRFGYSVFGHTPVKNVNFLRPNQQLIQTEEGRLVVEPASLDQFDKWRTITTTESDALGRFYSWKPRVLEGGREILPLSGGLDSRMILSHRLAEGKRPSCFTYGTSRRQVDSIEIEIAQGIAGQAGCSWQSVDLRGFHNEIPWWWEHFGPAVHLHGMYQVRFFQRLKQVMGRGVILSGLVGDLWAGSITCPPVHRPVDLLAYGLSRGLMVDDSHFVTDFIETNLEEEFISVKDRLRHEVDQIVYMIQTKMLLLSYLISVPEQHGFLVDAPFLDQEIALSFVTINQERRLNRQWQRDHLSKVGLDFVPKSKASANALLDLGELERHPLESLNPILLGKFVRVGFVEWVNSMVTRIPWQDRLWMRLIEFQRVLPEFGRRIRRPDLQEAYSAYLCLLPLQKLLELEAQ